MMAKNPKVACAKSVGSTCRVTLGSLITKPSTVLYQWYKGTKAIKGAKQATYVRRKGDTKLSVVVTFKKTGFVTRAWTLKLAS